ncbi:MAG: hypothetical protein JRH05_07135 [Deltaproteobacteria bacterium]|nr:hypothetical protein [Deltaproteobacteria bacterium]RLB36006.1 MAG: hypothetical protein DRH20_10400 [Deltaproteobacteria bacterium]
MALPLGSSAVHPRLRRRRALPGAEDAPIRISVPLTPEILRQPGRKDPPPPQVDGLRESSPWSHTGLALVKRRTLRRKGTWRIGLMTGLLLRVDVGALECDHGMSL